MAKDAFQWLQEWYHSHCDGDWEHDSGICLRTIDNPGWSLSVNLRGTEIENKPFDYKEINRSENDWLVCFIQNGSFESRCGTPNLPEVLKIFRAWVEKQM